MQVLLVGFRYDIWLTCRATDEYHEYNVLARRITM